MNMISTGAFLPEMDASNKQETTAEKFARVWEKKNAKAARAGGVSLMALSLAACGGSEAPAPVVEPDPEPEAPAVTTKNTALDDERDLLTTDASYSTGADTFTATADSLNATDVIAEPNAGDGDTLTVTLGDGDAMTAPASVTGIENVVINKASFSNDAIDVDNIIGATITVNNTQLGGTLAADVDNLGATSNLVLGDDVTAASTVNTLEGWTGSVDVGSATQVTITAAAAADTITATLNGDITLILATAETAVLSATAASDVTFTRGAVTDITGDANITLSSALANFDGITVAGAAAISGVLANADALDLTSVSSTIEIAAGGLAAGETADLTVADGASVSLLDDTGAGADLDFIAVDDEDADTETGQALTLALDVDYLGGISLSTSATDDDISTLNLVINEDQTATALDVSDISSDQTLNISGAGDSVITITNGGGDLTVNAAAATGALTGLSTAADVLSITTGAGDDGIAVAADDSVVASGAGDDTVTHTSGDDTSVDLGAGDDELAFVAGTGGTFEGGAGDDTLSTAAADEDFTTVTLSGFELLELDGDGDFLASQLNGATYVIADMNHAADSIQINAADSVDITSIDLSGLVFADADDIVEVNLGQIDASILLAGAAITYTGGDAVDSVTAGANGDTISTGAGADIIVGGAGADTITGGGGIDTITGGAGADIIDLTEATAAVDDVNIGVAGTAGIDVVTGFTAGAGGDTIGFLAADAYNDLTAEDYSAAADVEAAATLAIVDDNDTNANNGDNDAIAFSYGGNTYVVIQDDGDAAAFDDTADAIVQLVGVDAGDLVVANFIA